LGKKLFLANLIGLVKTCLGPAVEKHWSLLTADGSGMINVGDIKSHLSCTGMKERPLKELQSEPRTCFVVITVVISTFKWKF
jgi:hypothetical protein